MFRPMDRWLCVVKHRRKLLPGMQKKQKLVVLFVGRALACDDRAYTSLLGLMMRMDLYLDVTALGL